MLIDRKIFKTIYFRFFSMALTKLIGIQSAVTVFQEGYDESRRITKLFSDSDYDAENLGNRRFVDKQQSRPVMDYTCFALKSGMDLRSEQQVHLKSKFNPFYLLGSFIYHLTH
jgi:hypothetical protein